MEEISEESLHPATEATETTVKSSSETLEKTSIDVEKVVNSLPPKKESNLKEDLQKDIIIRTPLLRSNQ